MKKQKICIFGGTGFIGKHLVSRLSNEGYEVLILSRVPYRHRDFNVLPQVTVKKINDFSITTIEKVISGQDIIINLIGILNERGHGGAGFRKVHVDISKHIVEAAITQKIPRYLHMSALNANQARGTSFYLRTKGEAEDYVHLRAANNYIATSFRPSVVYGKGDSFTCLFAKLLRFFPFILFLPSAKSTYAPVHVDYLCVVILASVDNKEAFNQRLEICGEKQLSLLDMLKTIAKVKNCRTKVIGLGNKLSYLLALLFEYMPGKPYSIDNYKSSLVPSVCKTNQITFVDKINPCFVAELTKYLGEPKSQV